MVAQWLPEQKATKSNIPNKPTYTIRETSVIMDSYNKVMHATAHLPHKFQVQIVNTMATGTSSDPTDVDAPPPPSANNKSTFPPPPILDKDTRPTRKNPPSNIVVPGPHTANIQATAATTSTLAPCAPAAQSTPIPAPPAKPSFTQAAARETTVPPRPKLKTWVPMPQKTEKTPKKDERTIFHKQNTSTVLFPNTLVIHIISTDPKHEDAISTLIGVKREVILAMDSEHTIIDEGKRHIVVKTSCPNATKKIVKAFNDLTSEYSKKFNKDPKYANFFTATTKIQNTAVYTSNELLQTLKLNKCLADKIFVAPLPAYDKAPFKCINCNGAHPADSHECPCFVNRHDVWELRSILEKAAAERKAAIKSSKPVEEKVKAKDNMKIDMAKEGFDISPADEVDGWSRVGPAEIKSHHLAVPRTVAAYASRRLIQAKITHHHKAINHPDLMLISVKANGEQFYILNIYNDGEDTVLSHLLSHHNLPPITIIMGDFNISDK
ncbi:hypothetical protein AX16_006091 [Volvariella volvacea WC 439]|nr:hypothetical protein AX16_006091 [Volvariella volvacea WC 439]